MDAPGHPTEDPDPLSECLLGLVSPNVAFAYTCHQIYCFPYPKMLLSHTTRCCCIQLSSNMLFSVSRNVVFAYNCHRIRCFPYPKMLLLHTIVIKYIVSRIPKCCFCAHLSSNLLFPVSQNVAFAYTSYHICCFPYPKMLFLHTIVIKYVVSQC